MSSENRNEQTGEKDEEGIRHLRSADVEGHIRYQRGDDDEAGKGEEGIRHLRTETTDDAPEVEGHIRYQRGEEPDGDDGWVGGRGEEGVRRD